MWKKALWFYIGLYVVGVLYVIINYLVKNMQSGDFQPVALLTFLVLFIPAGTLSLGLKEKEAPILLSLLALLIVAVPVAGIFNFNDMSLATIGKALLFLPMIAGLAYFGFRRLFKK